MDMKHGMKKAEQQHGYRGEVKGKMEGNRKIDDFEKKEPLSVYHLG